MQNTATNVMRVHKNLQKACCSLENYLLDGYSKEILLVEWERNWGISLCEYSSELDQ